MQKCYFLIPFSGSELQGAEMELSFVVKLGQDNSSSAPCTKTGVSFSLPKRTFAILLVDAY